jgi:hypothetical protein
MSADFSRYDRKEKTQSVYCYKGTDVLINKENIGNAEDLAKYEADITMLQLSLASRGSNLSIGSK